MHEDFERSLRYSLMNLANLFQREFACQNHLTKSRIGQELHLLCIAIVHLRTCMKRYRREIQAQQAHVLHNECIHPDTVQIPYELLGIFQFLILQDGVESDIDTGIIQMGILHQLCNILKGIACCCSCTKTGRTDIYGIGTVVDSPDAAFQILGRSQKFNLSLSDHLI